MGFGVEGVLSRHMLCLRILHLFFCQDCTRALDVRTGSCMGPPQGKKALEKGLQEWGLYVSQSSHVNEASQIGSTAMASMDFTLVKKCTFPWWSYGGGAVSYERGIPVPHMCLCHDCTRALVKSAECVYMSAQMAAELLALKLPTRSGLTRNGKAFM